MGGGVHGLHLGGDEVVEAALVDEAQAVEAGTADDFLLEPFQQIRPFFCPDQNVNLVNAAQRVQKLLQQHFAEEACRARDEHALPFETGPHRHLQHL